LDYRAEFITKLKTKCRRFDLLRHWQPFRTVLELAQLGFDAWTAIGLRTLRLGAGRRAAALEAQRMMVEKTATMLEAQAAVGMALTTGSSRRATARKMMAPYRRRCNGRPQQAHAQSLDTQACKSAQHQERLLRALRYTASLI
jgi:hypothetical protein